jgi:hypothetical protein
LAYAGYELAKNPEIQKRLQEEIDLAYDEADGKTPSYSVVQVIVYLSVLKEEDCIISVTFADVI